MTTLRSSGSIRRHATLAAIFAVFILLLTTSACSRREEAGKSTGGPEQRELVVSAAASLKEVFTEAARLYEEHNPGVHVSVTLGASNLLARQIEQGAPVDVFASASDAVLDTLAAKGKIAAGTRSRIAVNDLVVIGGAETAPIDSLAELSGAGIARIALGAPGVPVRSYSEQALRATGAWDRLKDRFVFGTNVRQVLDYVATGEADAGLVYATDAATAADHVRVLLRVPGSLHDPITYGAAITAGARNPADAGRFLALINGADGAAIFARHGFRREMISTK